MQVIKVTWIKSDDGVEQSLLLVDPHDSDTLKWAYAAADAVHIPIGQKEAYVCKFDCSDESLPARIKMLEDELSKLKKLLGE